MTSFAIRTEITDAALCAYLQQYPFLSGPDEVANTASLNAIRNSVRLSSTTETFAVTRSSSLELSLSEEQNTIACEILRKTNLSETEIMRARDDYGWRVKFFPEATTSVLCLGSGEGVELAFLRAKLPNAQIVVLDYVKKLRKNLLEAVNAEFIQCDLVKELSDHSNVYDAAFSNHTLEHMYFPDLVLELIFARLRPQGVLVSGLPLDGDDSVPLFKTIVDISKAANSLHFIDGGLFDAGHPWKTNPADLKQALQGVGFEDILITQRSDTPFRTQHQETSLLAIRRQISVISYLLFFQPMRALLKILFPNTPPLLAKRVLVALERRVPFGANRIKSRYSPDVVFMATKP